MTSNKLALCGNDIAYFTSYDTVQVSVVTQVIIWRLVRECLKLIAFVALLRLIIEKQTF